MLGAIEIAEGFCDRIASDEHGLLGNRLEQPPHNRLLSIYNSDRPEVHELVAEMRGVVDEFPERVLNVDADGSPARVARFYDQAKAVITVHGDPATRTTVAMVRARNRSGVAALI